MFYILTFSYLVVLIVPCFILSLVPQTMAECGLCLTYFAAYRTKQPKRKDASDDQSEFRWKSASKLKTRLDQLVPEVFGLLFFPPKLDKNETEPADTAPRNLAYDWLKQINQLLVDSVDSWLKVIQLRHELAQIIKLYNQQLTAIETKVVTAQQIMHRYRFNDKGAPRNFTETEQQTLQRQDKLLTDWFELVQAIKEFQV